jgi:hypothetical protein
MKTARLVFPMFACAASLFGASYADPSRGPLRKPEHTGLVKPAKPAIRKPSANGRHPSLEAAQRAAAMGKPRQGVEGSIPATRNGTIPNELTGRSRPARQPGTVRAAMSPLSSLRHRSPNPAVITGSANFRNRSSGGIDGTQVHRRL